MTCGVGLFGTFSGFVVAWFLAPGTEHREDEPKQLREEIRAIRDTLDRIVPPAK